MQITIPRVLLPQETLDRGICEKRGHCGPYVNAEIYNSMPEWVGFADCVVCGTTIRVPSTAREPEPS
jgi:hypothetical protein